MNTDRHTSVLIVGAGPTGLMMACLLSRLGINFQIVDSKAKPSSTSNAIAIQALTLEILDQMGLVASFLAKGTRVHKLTIHDHSKVRLVTHTDDLESQYPFLLMLPQHETEQILIDDLTKRQIIIQRNARVNNAQWNKEHLIVTLKNKQGQKNTIKTDWLIACDGAHSAIREAIQMGFQGEVIDTPFFVADIDMKETTPKSGSSIHVFLSQCPLLGVFPLREKRYRIAGEFNPGQQTLNESTVKKWVYQRTQEQYQAQSVHWMSPFHIESKVVAKMRDASIFFAGDAAHIHSPLGGQGMNAGIQDVYNLAWKLAFFIQGKAKSILLDSYDLERRPVATAIVHITNRLTQLMISKNVFFVFVRRCLFFMITHSKRLRYKLMMRISQLSIRYVNSPIIHDTKTMSADSPQPGERAPDVLLDHHQRLHQYLAIDAYTLLLFSGKQHGEQLNSTWEVAIKRLYRRHLEYLNVYFVSPSPSHHESFRHIIDSKWKIHQRYRVRYPGLFLIRPDQVIAHANYQMDFAALQTFLDSL